jgi:hypothetical protein
MNKLTLKLEELSVDSFSTGANADARTERGTVRGHYGTAHTEFISCAPALTQCNTCYC